MVIIFKAKSTVTGKLTEILRQNIDPGVLAIVDSVIIDNRRYSISRSILHLTGLESPYLEVWL